jgi:hypothetical protein
MLYKTFTFLSLAWLACTAKAVVAQDNFTDDVFGGAGDDLFGNMTIPCKPETEAFDACNELYLCDESCLPYEATTAPATMPPFNFDPTNFTALAEQAQKELETNCATSGEDYCIYLQCCSSCQAEAEAALRCYFTEAIPTMQNALEDMLSSVGGLLDTLLLAANEMTNETIAPSMNFAEIFGDLFTNFTCDIAAYECGPANATRH